MADIAFFEPFHDEPYIPWIILNQQNLNCPLNTHLNALQG
jgi:hypothetical protein